MTTVITSRIDSARKERMEKICEDIGMSMSAALNVLVTSFVNHGGFPFEVRSTAAVETPEVTAKLAEAEQYAAVHSERLSLNEVYARQKERINARRSVYGRVAAAV